MSEAEDCQGAATPPKPCPQSPKTPAHTCVMAALCRDPSGFFTILMGDISMPLLVPEPCIWEGRKALIGSGALWIWEREAGFGFGTLSPHDGSHDLGAGSIQPPPAPSVIPPVVIPPVVILPAASLHPLHGMSAKPSLRR